MADYDHLKECLPILILALKIAQSFIEEKKKLNAGITAETTSNSSSEENLDHVIKWLPICKAAIKNDWENVKCFFEEKKLDLDASITETSETPLHVAVATNSSQLFVEELVELIIKKDPQMLWTCDKHGNTPLHHAALVGNTQAARLLVQKDPELAQLVNHDGHTALKLAAAHGWKETLCYLLEVTKDVINNVEEGTSPYQGKNGADLLALVITADFYDVALNLVRKYPNLVMEKNEYFGTGLQTLATKPNAFQSGFNPTNWVEFIYSRIPVDREKALDLPFVGPLNKITILNRINKASSGLNVLFWRVIQYIAPHVKKVHDCKVRHIQAEELVKQMCSEVIKMGDQKIAWDVLGVAMSTAVKHGIHDLIQECIHQYPSIIGYEIDGFSFFLAAIKERRAQVYILVYQMSRHRFAAIADKVNGENALHYAGKLSPPHCLNTVTGAALQMQRELQWFKEVEKDVKPLYQEAVNRSNKTPRMVFTEAHKELLKEAQQWMKDTSSSATIVAALIVTVAFAAIFTAPGGIDDNGKPRFLDDGGFILFAISDAIALFSSSTSVLMFLSILNSRYAEDDFLYALPKRLTIGLISLHISIAATMFAFSAALSFLLCYKVLWIPAPVFLIACIPIYIFLWLQISLFQELVSSTYGRGIFRKHSNLLLH